MCFVCCVWFCVLLCVNLPFGRNENLGRDTKGTAKVMKMGMFTYRSHIVAGLSIDYATLNSLTSLKLAKPETQFTQPQMMFVIKPNLLNDWQESWVYAWHLVNMLLVAVSIVVCRGVRRVVGRCHLFRNNGNCRAAGFPQTHSLSVCELS